MLGQIIFLIYTIAACIFGLHIIKRRLPNSKHNLRKYKDRFTSIEFKPLKNISLEEYIALLPEPPKTSIPAILAELDREGKIDLSTTDDKSSFLKKTKITVTRPDLLTSYECNFLAALKVFCLNSHASAISALFLKTVGGSKNSIYRINHVTDADLLAVTNPSTPWTLTLRKNTIFEVDPLPFLTRNGELRQSLIKKELIAPSPRPQIPRGNIVFETILILPLILVFGPISIIAILRQYFNLPTLFTLVPKNPNSAATILGAIICFLPVLTGIIMAFRLSAISRFERYTIEGLDVLNYYDGLKRYMKHVEADRIKTLQDKRESNFLELTPYAILFGLEKTWSKKFRYSFYES